MKSITKQRASARLTSDYLKNHRFTMRTKSFSNLRGQILHLDHLCIRWYWNPTISKTSSSKRVLRDATLTRTQKHTKRQKQRLMSRAPAKQSYRLTCGNRQRQWLIMSWLLQVVCCKTVLPNKAFLSMILCMG